MKRRQSDDDDDLDGKSSDAATHALESSAEAGAMSAAVDDAESYAHVSHGLADDAESVGAAVVATPLLVPPVKKRRTTQPIGNLTNAQKRMLCVRFAQVKMTQQELCVWAKEEFKLTHLPHQSTISKILARSNELTSMASRDLSARRKGLVTHPELDTALCNWVLFARQSNTKLSGDMIKDKARQLALKLGLSSKMTFSNGWLGGFKKRHNIRLGGTATGAVAGANGALTSTSASVTNLSSVSNSNLHGLTMPSALLDASAAAAGLMPSLGSPDAAAMSAFSTDPSVAFAHMAGAPASNSALALPLAVRELQECVKLYHPSDVFALSETGLYYALPPEKPASRTARAAATAAAKRERERLTIALAVNADGSEQLEPFFVGTTALPRKALVSTGADGDEPIVFRYRDNRRAWVTPVIFQDWIGLLDSKLRDEHRSILLLIAHAPSHIRIGLELTNIRLEMVPPSTTRQYQPFEAGIFDAFKRRYRRHQLHHALDRFEAGQHDDIFHVDVLQAMRWARACWFALPQATLKHYWDATELSATSCSSGAPGSTKTSPQLHQAIEDVERALEIEICDAVAALQVARPLTVHEIVSPSDESVSLHCTGADDSDVLLSVSETPERAFAAAKLANELTLAESMGMSGSSGGDPLAAAAAAMAPVVHNITAGLPPNGFGTRTTNEQLLESLKVLLPELDRLRFDEHTKNSIRMAFRRLKEKEAEQSMEMKQRHASARKGALGASMSTSSSMGGSPAHSAAALASALATAAAVTMSVAELHSTTGDLDAPGAAPGSNGNTVTLMEHETNVDDHSVL